MDTDNVYRRVSARAYAALLLHYLRPHRGSVAWLSLFVFGYTGVRLAAPQIVRYFIDTARAGGEISSLMWTAALYVCVALGRQLCFLGSSYFSQDVGWRATNRMRSELGEHCLRLGGIEDVRTNGAVAFILDRFFQVNRDAYGRVVRSEVMGAVLRSITMVL